MDYIVSFYINLQYCKSALLDNLYHECMFCAYTKGMACLVDSCMKVYMLQSLLCV